MRKIFTICLLSFSTLSAFAQVPEKMSYQAVIRGSNNTLLTSQHVGIQISILQGSAFGTPIYVEIQSPSTNTNGLVSIEIGNGTVVSGNFNAIDWSNGPYFVKTETDPTGGTVYTITGTSQLLSVPYALYAKTSGSSTPGPQGTQGIDGINGTDGQNSLVKSTNELAGANCATGGVKVEYGLDANSNGILEAGEIDVSLTRYVCNGAVGPLVAGNSGEILYHDGTTWVTLAAGTSGQVLVSNGTSAPSWQSNQTFYADRDGDGYGDKYGAYTSLSPTAPTGYVANNTDCDDNNVTNTTAAPTTNPVTDRTSTTFTARWAAVPGATAYYLDVATNSGFTSFLSGYNNQNVGNLTSVALSNLDACTDYYYRVRAVAACGTSVNSNTVNSGVFHCVTFNYTGTDQTFTVPAGVMSLTVQLYGAAGGPGSTGWYFGKGGYVEGNLSVTSGTQLTVIVGARGADGGQGSTWNVYGGGQAGQTSGAGGGGGRSSIQLNGADLVVAGGGGGSARFAYSGGAGGTTEGSGTGGGGGSSINGGTAGTSYTSNATFNLITQTAGANGGSGVVKITW